MKDSNCYVRFNHLKIVVEKVLSGDMSIIKLADEIFSQSPYCTTHRMIDYTHLRLQRHRKLLLLTNINMQSTFLPDMPTNVHRIKKLF